MLEVRKISKKFGANQVLKDCSFSLKKKEFVALVGENGSGKSTFFNIILGVIAPDQGQVFLNDEEVSGRAVYNIAKKGIYSSFQSSGLFDNISVQDHLMMAQDDSDTRFFKNLLFPASNNQKKMDRVEEVLINLEIEKIRRSPVAEISYGQRKLVNLGMSLLTPQKILLLDEIFAGVNARLITKVKNMLARIKQIEGKSFVLITHDLRLAHEIGDRVVYMKNGSIIE